MAEKKPSATPRVAMPEAAEAALETLRGNEAAIHAFVTAAGPRLLTAAAREAELKAQRDALVDANAKELSAQEARHAKAQSTHRAKLTEELSKTLGKARDEHKKAGAELEVLISRRARVREQVL